MHKIENVTVACRACGSTSLQYLYDCDDFSSTLLKKLNIDKITSGHLMRCGECGLGQRLPCPSDEHLADIYRQSPPGEMDYDFHCNAAWVRAKKKITAQWLKSERISVLDIGCNEGGFLKALPKNWKRYGIESGKAPLLTANRNGVDIIAEQLQTVDSKWQRQFNVVTMFDVLEHLPNPIEGIQQAALLVKPGGMLIISTGDMDAWTWKWFRGSHWYLQTPLHLSFANRRFFNYVEERCSLNIDSYQRIPHQRGTVNLCWRDRIEALYFGARIRGGLWRVLQRLMQTWPGWRYLRHRMSVPWTFRIRDHVLVTYNP